MNVRVLSKAYHEAIESLAFHRAIALLRTDRDHEQKLVLTRLFALHPVAVSTVKGFLVLLKVSLSSELKSLLRSMCIEAPESTTNKRSSVFLESSPSAFFSTGD